MAKGYFVAALLVVTLLVMCQRQADAAPGPLSNCPDSANHADPCTVDGYSGICAGMGPVTKCVPGRQNDAEAEEDEEDEEEEE